jgi:hypothetical protein
MHSYWRMSRHPVQLTIARAARIPRIHVVIRLVLLLALGTIGCSSIYWFLYLALPALVAAVITQKGGPRYLGENAPKVVRVLRWFASAYGYLWLLTNDLPTSEGSHVDLQIAIGGAPTVASAVLRLLTSLPALLLVTAISLAAALAWLVAAAFVLAVERMPTMLADFLTLTLRVQFRMVAYHLSLVERYPSLEESLDAEPERATSS